MSRLLVLLALVFLPGVIVAASPEKVDVAVSSAAIAAIKEFQAANPKATPVAILATGYMAPTIDENWVVFIEVKPFSRVRVRDIIAFNLGDGEQALHRVTQVIPFSGVRVRGDANPGEDNLLVRQRDYLGTAIAAVHRESGQLKRF